MSVNGLGNAEHAVEVGGMIEDEGLRVSFSYDKEEYDKSTMEKLSGLYKANLQKLVTECVEKKKELGDRGQTALDYHFEQAYNAYLERIKAEAWPDLTETNQYKHILLTGATGYLGAYLVPQLLERTEAVLYLLVRGETLGDAEERLKKRLVFYFGAAYVEEHKERLQVVRSNLRAARFGVKEEQYKMLSDTVDAVVHSAANVKHYGDYDEFYKDNVEGTVLLLDFALTGKKKDFHFISTRDSGVGDIPGRDWALYTEYDLYLGQLSDNVYIRSKSEAERQVAAYREKGLDTSIYRAGNMTFHSETGKFQENIGDNFTYSMMKTLMTVGFWTDKMRTMPVELSFVNYAAESIVRLLTRGNLKNEIYHIYNPEFFSWNDMAALLKEAGFDVADLDIAGGENDDHLAKFKGDSDYEKLIEKVKLYSWLWEGKAGTLTMPKVDRTVALLGKMGFQWPKTNQQHIEKMVEYCREVGFL